MGKFPIMVTLLLTATQTAMASLSDASEIASTVLEQLQTHITGTSRSSQARFGGYGGCTDNFSIFGFLAFLLALLDLILDLQANMAAAARKKRGVENQRGDQLSCEDNTELQQATSASYSLLRGFLNALASEDTECAKRFLCEGAEEAATAGPLGEIIANVASVNAGEWLLKANATKFAGVGEAGQRGSRSRGCAFQFAECYALPSAYRYPAVYRGPQLPSEAYEPVLQEVMDAVKRTILA